ncbi:MAG: hypothetical protein ACI3ZF_05840 [Candidatus Cryptobacteroides sp.]
MIIKHFKHIILLLSLSLLWACTPSDKPSEGDKPDPDPSIPAPPEQIKEANVFIIDFFSTLGDEGDFFISRDAGVAAEHIKAQSGKLSLVYIFDRADYQVGKDYSMTKIAYNCGAFPYFAQSEPFKDGVVKGSGMVTRYPISDYDGVASDGIFLSGCTIQLPITLTEQLCIATAYIQDEQTAQKIFTEKKLRLLSDMMIVGTVPSSAASQVQAYFESMSLRVRRLESSDTKKDLIVVLPASYVCRSFEEGKRVNLPYYRIYIEKWM